MNLKKLSIAGIILSALSIIPIAFLCINMNNLLNLQHIGGVDPKVAEALLKRTLSSPMYLWPIILGFVVYSISATVAAFLLKDKVKGLLKWQASLLLIFGGFGIASVIGIIWIIKNRRPREIRESGPIRKIGIVSVGLLTLSPIPFIAISATYEGLDYRTFAKPIQYSLDSKHPNLIEIFSDGYDQGHINPILKREADPSQSHDGVQHFDDFTSFPLTFAQGFLTNISIPPIWGGDKYNPFMVRKLRDEYSPTDTPLDYSYKNTFTEAAVEHMNDIPVSNFAQVSMVNTASMSDSAAYASTVSGDPHNIWKVQKEMHDHQDDFKFMVDPTPYNIVNWADAKDYLTGSVGTTRYNHDGVFYKWMENNAAVTKTGPGARVLMQDFITHTPMTGNLEGKLKWNSGSDKYERVVRTFEDFFDSLPAGVYDNSMIVVYGDHADHSRKSFDESDPTMFEGNRTFSMVKYPNQSGSKTQYKDDTAAAIYVPYLRQLAIHYFANKDTTSNEINWIETDKHFDKTQTFPVYNSNYNQVWAARVEDHHNGLGEQLYNQVGKDKAFDPNYDSGMGWA